MVIWVVWFEQVQCKISDHPKIHQTKVLCPCPFEDRVPEKEASFLKDQRGERRMMISASKDLIHTKQFIKRLAHKPKNSSEDWWTLYFLIFGYNI